MIKTIDAVFDGQVLRPDDPLELEPNTRVRITIETVPPETPKSGSFLDVARSLNLDGPPDWAENIDEYLYGGKCEKP
ncbi:MAG: antitoxin AF2212-like protein [Planctomycetaceae bacterium]